MPPPEQAESSRSYRNPTVEEDDDDDLDDLDDVLASFNNTSKPSASTAVPTQPSASHNRAAPPSDLNNDNEEDFEASLMEGMDALLKQLAGDHPPGPMIGKSTESIPKSSNTPGGIGLSKEAEEEAWQKALEMVLSGEGLKAMGLDESSNINSNKSTETSSVKVEPSINKKSNYEETLAKTLESLNIAGKKPNGEKDNDLSNLLASLGGDSDLLKDLNLNGIDGEGEDGDFADVLEGMMRQLMNKEVLEEPMNELASKYPAYLASPPSEISKEDLLKYQKQNLIVQKIVNTFKKLDYTDEKDGKEIANLVGEMQDLGGPPKEIMGDLPEGFDLGALGGLGNEDGCTIM
ncbi:uncharacterized protein I206_104654 [Kwoniella pini CBS 10737]|uniref:Peroxin-19 n=1 Tax=Kwoniella pini CBS 10737 TaxID=1296096 RepID=A0A1B9I7I4_9TREE|nr:uncharacterized protein I206_02192 [Kwoniella pini CBS 10737]OCF51478.1 hypothetical protein I206_02192 [Kwoniella pini CBS 10737]